MVEIDRRSEAETTGAAAGGPIATWEDDRLKNITCEDSFIASSILIDEDRNLQFNLTSPILSDITIEFDYDAYFNVNDNEMDAIQEVKNEMFLHVIKKSPLLLNESGVNVTLTSETCDALVGNTIKSMLSMRQGQQQRRAYGDGGEYEWDYYLGWKSQLDVIHNDKSCQVDKDYCKPITSSLIAQVPVARELNEMMVKAEVLRYIRDGFVNGEFVTDSVHNLTFIGMSDNISQGPTDVIDDNKQHDKETELPGNKAGVMSAFGISATALLGLLTLFTCGIFGYKVKGRTNAIRRASFKEEDLIEVQEQPEEKKVKSPQVAESIYTHTCSDGVELVHMAEKGENVDGKFSEAINLLNHQESDIQTGFNGLSLSAWMESLRNDNDSFCGSHVNKAAEDDEDEDELLFEEEASDDDDEDDDDEDDEENVATDAKEDGSLGYTSEDCANTVDTGLQSGMDTVKAENSTRRFKEILNANKRHQKK